MEYRAKGTFQVKLSPLASEEVTQGAALGRMALDKTFSGDLIGTSRGEMLSAMSRTPGSAGYVAIERVQGTLNGREGSFVLQHSGTMDRGAQTLWIRVVPDSGTGELVGLSGEFLLRIEQGQHFYELAYCLPG